MPMSKLVRGAGNILVYRATWGGSQNFLGARWVERVVEKAPALNCFGRSMTEMVNLATRCGFTEVVARPLCGSISVPGDDIPDQHLLTARRP